MKNTNAFCKMNIRGCTMGARAAYTFTWADSGNLSVSLWVLIDAWSLELRYERVAGAFPPCLQPIPPTKYLGKVGESECWDLIFMLSFFLKNLHFKLGMHPWCRQIQFKNIFIHVSLYCLLRQSIKDLLALLCCEKYNVLSGGHLYHKLFLVLEIIIHSKLLILLHTS